MNQAMSYSISEKLRDFTISRIIMREFNLTRPTIWQFKTASIMTSLLIRSTRKGLDTKRLIGVSLPRNLLMKATGWTTISLGSTSMLAARSSKTSLLTLDAQRLKPSPRETRMVWEGKISKSLWRYSSTLAESPLRTWKRNRKKINRMNLERDLAMESPLHY